jgi:hypothetical protein
MIADERNPHARDTRGQFQLQVYHSNETNYANAVTRWSTPATLILHGADRWVLGGGVGDITYPTWMDETATSRGDDAFQSVDPVNGSVSGSQRYIA